MTDVAADEGAGPPTSSETVSDVDLVGAAGQSMPRALGRYVPIDELGSGGVGTVYRAYDPRLHREVAVKVLRADVLDPQASARLVREAQAMAQLSHPNVVAVYDVETRGDDVVLAMELVEGTTLRQWLATAAPTPTQILDTFGEAALGLAAAHAAGLVHRDFKPSNVLLGRDGSVKVTDFGLAKPAALSDASDGSVALVDPPSPAPRVPPTVTSTDSLSQPLTRIGAVVGTPRYMAPEQYSDRSADGRADQFAWCVALWEALVGAPPFQGSAAVLVVRKRKGPPPWPRVKGVSSRVGETLVRGLAPDPADRFASMQALLTALRPPRRRPREVVVAGALVGVCAAVVVGAALGGRTDPCPAPDDVLAPDWTSARGDAVAEAIEGTAVPYAADTAVRVTRGLQTYAQQWTQLHHEICVATKVRAEQTAAAMAMQMSCLRRARMRLATAVEFLEHVGPGEVGRAATVVAGLPDIEACADLVRLQAQTSTPDDPQQAAAVDEAGVRVARVRGLIDAASLDEARREADDLVATARTIGWAPLLAEALQAHGDVLEDQGEFQGADASLREAVQLAVEQRRPNLASQAAAELSQVLLHDQTRNAEARSFADLAVAFARAAGDDPLGRARAEMTRANVLVAEADLVGARESFSRALDALGQAHGADSPKLAPARTSLASVLAQQGELQEAEAQFRRAIDEWEQMLGPSHPHLAVARGNLANALSMREAHAEAVVEHRRAVQLLSDSLGADNPRTVIAQGNLALALRLDGDLAAARTQGRLALEGAKATFGAEHPRTATAHEALANTLEQLGDLGGAARQFQRAAQVWEAAHSPDHPSAAAARAHAQRVHERAGATPEDDAGTPPP